MKAGPLAAAIAMAALAAAVAVIKGSRTDPHDSPGRLEPRISAGQRHSWSNPDSTQDPTNSTVAAVASAVAGSRAATPPPATKSGRPRRAEPHLEQRARIVERQANHELRRLIPLLDLTPEQQQRVFAALVRSTAAVTVTPQPLLDANEPERAAAANPALLAELTDEQVEAYLQDADERSEWWREFIEGIVGNLAAETPLPDGNGGTPAAAGLPTKELPEGFVEE